MQRSLSSWCLWSALGAIILKVVIVLMLITCFHAPMAASTLTESYWGPASSPLEESSRLSQVVVDAGAQQARYACPVVWSSLVLPLPHWHPNRPWSVSILPLLSLLLVFSRKVCPPSHSTDDDSFLC
jgi:hypothetical protein